MTFPCTVVVGTFGDDPKWQELAVTRAIPSAEALSVPVIHYHGTGLADARNGGLAQVDTEFVVHLDADDCLEPGFFEAMAKGTADVRAPALRNVRGTQRGPAKVPHVASHRHTCSAPCLADGNYIVCGAMIRTQVVRDIGGWEDFGVYEDWQLFVKAWQAGATIESVPGAVYRAFVSPASRMRGLTRAQIIEGHNAVSVRHGLPLVG